MKTPAQRWFCTVVVLLALDFIAPAQEIPPPAGRPPGAMVPPGRRLPIPPAGQASQPDPANLLAENYRVTLTISGIAPEKAESSVLTSSKQISLTNVIPVPGDAGLLQHMEFSGFLGDPAEGRLELSYSLNMSFPTPDTVKAIQKGITANGVHYLNERASGTLRVMPGKSYEVLRSGIRTYTLKVEAESDGK